MIKIINGDILNCTEDIIVHQVNVAGVMGGGIALQLAKKYEKLEETYAEFCELYNNNYNKLKGKVFKVMLKGKFIMNMFSQKPNFNTDYDAMKIGLNEIKEYAKSYNLSIAIPYKIGCGIANGDWNTILEIIDRAFKDYEVTIYKLERS